MPHAALALAAVLWLVALAPAPPPTSVCPSAACAAAARKAPGQLLFGGRLDANRASPASLEVLPGIGPARAQAIAAERCRAPFVGVGDLRRVPGIGPRTLRRIGPWLEVTAGARAACRGVD